MQAVDQPQRTETKDLLTRVMAGFGTLVAVLLIGLAIVYGAVLVAGAVSNRSSASDMAAVTAPDNYAFRADERAPLAATAASTYAFRAGERGDGTVSTAALQNAFRAGERGDGTVSAVSLHNAFRAGERGDQVGTAH